MKRTGGAVLVLLTSCAAPLKASALADEARRNEVAAALRARGSGVEASGNVVEIGFATPDRMKAPREFRGRPFVSLRLDGGALVTCFLQRNADVSQLAVGAPGSLRGEFYSLGKTEDDAPWLTLRGCR